jgi:hypothetical protein
VTTHIDQLAPEAIWLESVMGFDRYAVDAEHSVWVCGDCGAVIDAAEEGCAHCGRGVEQDPDEEALEWA